MTWIQVKDKLPEQGQRVIYYFEKTGVSCGKYMRTPGGDCFYSPGGWLTNDVTHWMPLPEAPNDEVHNRLQPIRRYAPHI